MKHDVTGELITVSMSHKWPVRKPRPVAEKLPGKEALITGEGETGGGKMYDKLRSSSRMGVHVRRNRRGVAYYCWCDCVLSVSVDRSQKPPSRAAN